MSDDRFIGREIQSHRVNKKLGEGGFGAVYLAEHVDLPRKVAIKILHPEYARHEPVVQRFFREARAACAIGHPAIVDIHHLGRLDTGEPFIILDFVPGQPLSSVIDSGVRFPPGALIQLMWPIASALETAHARKIIHRDLKPDNIMVDLEGDHVVDVRLLDFGIAKLLEPEPGAPSVTGHILGTPGYMAPEQARDAKNIDARADVYGLSATIYATLGGRAPFVGTSATDVLIAAATTEVTPLDQLAPNVPPALARVVERGLSRDLAQRPASIQALWLELCEVAGSEMTSLDWRKRHRSNPQIAVDRSGTLPKNASAAGIAPTMPSGVATTLGSAAGSTAPTVLPAPPAPPKRRLALGITAGVVVAGGAVAIAVAMSGGGTSREAIATADHDSAPKPAADAAAGAIDAGATPIDAPELVAADAAVAMADAAVALFDAAIATRIDPTCEAGALLRRIAASRSPGIARMERKLGACRAQLTAGDLQRVNEALAQRRATFVTPAPRDAGVVAPPDAAAPAAVACTVGAFTPLFKSSSKTEIQAALARLNGCIVIPKDQRDWIEQKLRARL